MELKTYTRILFKRIWLILLLPLLAAATSAFVSFYMINPVYGSATTLYVVDKSADWQKPIGYENIMASEMLVKDYRELIRSRAVTEEVIEQLDLEKMKPAQLAKKISISLKKDTRVLEITAYAESAWLARDIADKVVEVFARKVIDIMKVDVINVIDTAEMPDKPARPKPLLNIFVALAAGLVAAVSAVLVYEFVNDTVRDSGDVEKYMGLSVLGAIPSLNIE